MTIHAYVAAVLIATLYGAGFHFVFGGSGRRLLLYLLSGWLGFALGHVLGDWLGIRVFVLGPLNVFAATVASFLALFSARWLTAPNPRADEP